MNATNFHEIAFECVVNNINVTISLWMLTLCMQRFIEFIIGSFPIIIFSRLKIVVSSGIVIMYQCIGLHCSDANSIWNQLNWRDFVTPTAIHHRGQCTCSCRNRDIEDVIHASQTLQWFAVLWRSTRIETCCLRFKSLNWQSDFKYTLLIVSMSICNVTCTMYIHICNNRLNHFQTNRR